MINRNLDNSVRSHNHKRTSKTSPTIRKVDICPSPIISLFFNSSVVHLTLDCGAEANCITKDECNRLQIKVKPAGQLARQLDNSKLNVIGEIHVEFSRGSLSRHPDFLPLDQMRRSLPLDLEVRLKRV